MKDDGEHAIARFEVVGGDGEPLEVHFNPVSLEYTVTNSLKDTGSGNRNKQYVSQATGKLSMELIFDTTHTGEDVRLTSRRLAQMMKPADAEKDEDKAPPVVLFEWGNFKFQGMFEQYKETLDFFSANGVPLRAKVSVSLAEQDIVYEPEAENSADVTDALDIPQAPDSAVKDAAPEASAADHRAQGALNGVDSLRFGSGGSLTLAADASIGVSGGISLGAGAGVTSGGLTGSASIASSASLGSSSDDPFGGLRVGASSGGGVDVSRLRASRATKPAPRPTVGASSVFDLGGRVKVGGEVALGADVGRGLSLRDRINFDEA